jgi:hypothetical protein
VFLLTSEDSPHDGRLVCIVNATARTPMPGQTQTAVNAAAARDAITVEDMQRRLSQFGQPVRVRVAAQTMVHNRAAVVVIFGMPFEHLGARLYMQRTQLAVFAPGRAYFIECSVGGANQAEAERRHAAWSSMIEIVMGTFGVERP